jgi:SAM-dependent methyltransferase
VFDRSAELYDAFYDALGKDYAGEAGSLRERIGVLRPEAATLLDVACGTGRHLEYLSRTLRCVGLDINPGLLAVARRRCPQVTFVEADMTDFDLGQRFDAVTCLFSSIGYVVTERRLTDAVLRMARHLNLGLFTWEQYVAAFERALLSTEVDPVGPTGRGLIVGVAS